MRAHRRIALLACLVSAATAPPAFAAFDCGKASLPSDFVICASPRALQANEAHGKAWLAARDALDDEGRKSLLSDQRRWIKNFGPDCGLTAAKPDAGAISRTEPCIFQAIADRTALLSRVAAAKRLTAIGEVRETVETPKGTLAIVEAPESGYYALLGSQILHANGTPIYLYEAKPRTPVVLLAVTSGSSVCKATFLLVDVRPSPALVSQAFGNCAPPRVEDRADMLRLAFPAAGEAGSETWEYRPGDLRQVATGPAGQATWQTSETPGGVGMLLTIRDKWGALGQYKATFAVKDQKGKRWARTITASGDEAAERMFPDDFDAPAGGGSYSYEIVVNDEVVAKGAFTLSAAAAAPASAPAPAATAKPAPAPQPPQAQPQAATAFGAQHLPLIIETSQTNSARFARDFKGKTFRSHAFFAALEDGFFGQKQLMAAVDGMVVQCFGRSELARAAIDWRSGEVIAISGTISDTVLGQLIIDPCTASK